MVAVASAVRVHRGVVADVNVVLATDWYCGFTAVPFPPKNISHMF